MFPGEIFPHQKQFYVVSVTVDGQVVAFRTVSAYTQDHAIILVLLPEILIRMGLQERPLDLEEKGNGPEESAGHN